MTNIKPLGMLILVEKAEAGEKKTASGFIMTAASLENELSRGKVIAVGDGSTDIYGKNHPINVEVGETVLFHENSLTEVTDDSNNKYHFISFNNLLGKITNA